MHVDGALVFDGEELGGDDFLKAAFHHLAVDYPKFHKMDRLSKLAFLGSEYLLNSRKDRFGDEEVALCFFCGSSSLDTDYRHQQHIDSGAKVSPSVFVYTLPNILLGEIAIRNKWYGENLLILAGEFDEQAWLAEAELLISSGKAGFCLGGWVEVLEDHYQLQLYLVGSSTETNQQLN